MRSHELPGRNRPLHVIVGPVAALLIVLVCSESAWAIPVFSRKYQTSCVTCHTIYPQLNDVGEAFRRNGYQFPSDDTLVKEEPVKLGVDAYKEMWPNSIWPSTLPSIPPVAIRTQMWNIVNTTPIGPPEKSWDLEFPHELGLMGAGTYGKDISGWWQVVFAPAEDEVGVERAFVQFSNLFAWDEDEDEDGAHLGNRWIVLPKYALNLRLGKMETSVLPHIASEHSRLPIIEPLPNLQTIGLTGFSFEGTQLAVEAHGVIRQYWSYAVGIANGGSASDAPQDDNTFKDVYARVSHKWFGFPLDGVIGQPGQSNAASTQIRGQSEDDEAEPPGLDFWRAVGFETGIWGWEGKSLIPPVDPFSAALTKEYFQRVGGDFRLQYFDLNLFGLAYWGHDHFAGLLDDGTDLGQETHFSYMVEAEYFFKPWLLGFVRYEQTKMNDAPRAALQDQARVVPGIIWLCRQNVKLQTDAYINVGHRHVLDAPEAQNQIITQLDMAF